MFCFLGITRDLWGSPVGDGTHYMYFWRARGGVGGARMPYISVLIRGGGVLWGGLEAGGGVVGEGGLGF